MATSASASDPEKPESSEIERDPAPIQGHNRNVKARVSEPEPSDLEELATYEGHDADVPSNEGYILDARGELRRQQSIARQRSASRNKSHGISGKHGANGDLENATGGAPGEEGDPNIVWWDGPDDPQNPLNWGRWLRMLNIFLVSGICFVTPLASSMFAPGVPDLMKEFNSTNTELGAFVVSVYVLGFAFGPMFLAPLSEIYGRLPIYHVCNISFMVFNIACALATNLNMLIGFRFLAGIFGSAPLTNGGGSITDIVRQEKRGRAMSFFVIG